MEVERDTVNPDARFKMEVRDILKELRERAHRLNDRVEVQERRLGNLQELDKRIELLDRGIAARDSAINRVENDVRTLTRGLNNLSVRTYELGEVVARSEENTEVITEKVEVIREGQKGARALIDKNRADIAKLKQRSSDTTPANAPAPIKYNLPIFWAAPMDKPVRFLRALVNYLAAVKATPENFKYIIEQSLRGSAYEWWLTAKYWGEGIQNKIRRELEFGYYRADGPCTRSEYIMSRYIDVKMLSDAPATPLVIEKFSRHFDAGIQ